MPNYYHLQRPSKKNTNSQLHSPATTLSNYILLLHYEITFLCYTIKTITTKHRPKKKPIQSLKIFPLSSCHSSWFANPFPSISIHQCYNDLLLTNVGNWIVPLKIITPFPTCNLHAQNNQKESTNKL